MIVSDGKSGLFQTWNPAFTGFSVNPTGYTARYLMLSDKVCMAYYQGGSPGTSNATTKTITLPFPAANTSVQTLPCPRLDAGVRAFGLLLTRPNSNIADVYASAALANWTASGNCDFFFSVIYEIA